MSEIDYIVSDGYDVAQTAICFPYQYVGRKASEICGKDKRGKELTIKLKCYREVHRFVVSLHCRAGSYGQAELRTIRQPMDTINCFEKEQEDNALKLSVLEFAINCYMNGMVQSEVCAELEIGRRAIHHRKAKYPTEILQPLRHVLIRN